MGEIRNKANQVYADGPALAPYQPPKPGIRELNGLIEDSIAGGNLSIVTAQQLVQKKLCVIDMGFDDGTTNTEIFTGSGGTAQGMTIAEYNGVKRIFLRQPVPGGSVAMQKIVQVNFVDDGSTIVPTVWSEDLNIGHQLLSTFTDAGDLWFIAELPADPAYTGINYGKGYSKVKWQGSATDQGDVVGNRIFGYDGTGHPYSDLYNVNACIAPDGDTLAILALDTKDGPIDDTAQYLMILSRSDAEANGLNVSPQNGPLAIIPPTGQSLFYRQGLCFSPNGGHIAILRGYTNAYGQHCLQIFDRFANPVRDIYFDDVRSDYTRAELGNHPTLGFPRQMECEGSYWDEDGIVVLTQESWRAPGAIVTYRGYNYTTRMVDGVTGQNLNHEPFDSDWWQLTDKTATHGAWNSATDYGGPGAYTRRRKVLYRIQVPSGQAGEKALETGVAQKMAGSTVFTGYNARDIGYGLGTVLQISAWIANTGRGMWLNALAHFQHQFRVHDTRLGADNDKFASLTGSFVGSNELSEWRVRGTIASGAGINLVGNGHPTQAGAIVGYTGGLNRLEIDNHGQTLLSSDSGYVPASFNRGDNGKMIDLRIAAASVGGVFTGTGSPEGVVTAPVSSVFLRRDGSTSTTLYVKTSGTGNTGWTAK